MNGETGHGGYEQKFFDLRHRTKNDGLTLRWLNEYALRGDVDNETWYILLANVLRQESAQALHDQLAEQNDMKRSELSESMGMLVRRMKNLLMMHDVKLSVELDIEQCWMPSKKMFYMGLILSELITMSIEPNQKVCKSIFTASTGRDGLFLKFESGEYKAEPPQIEGFGSHIFDTMISRQLKGTYLLKGDVEVLFEATIPNSQIQIHTS